MSRFGHPLEWSWVECPWNLPSLMLAASTTTTLSLVSLFTSGSAGIKSTPPDTLIEIENPKFFKEFPMVDWSRCEYMWTDSRLEIEWRV